MIGKTIRELVPGVDPQIMKHYDSVFETGQKTQFEEYVTELDSWFAAEIFPTGIKRAIAVLFNNISERKRIEAALQESEEQKTYLLKLSDALREMTDPVAIQAVAARLLGEYLGANQVHYGETVGELSVIHQGWSNGLPPMIGSFRQQDFGKHIHEGYRGGRTQVCMNFIWPFIDLMALDNERIKLQLQELAKVRNVLRNFGGITTTTIRK